MKQSQYVKTPTYVSIDFFYGQLSEPSECQKQTENWIISGPVQTISDWFADDFLRLSVTALWRFSCFTTFYILKKFFGCN